MIRHDGYDEEELLEDVEDKRNVILTFDDISSIKFEEKVWGSVLQLEYEKTGKPIFEYIKENLNLKRGFNLLPQASTAYSSRLLNLLLPNRSWQSIPRTKLSIDYLEPQVS